MSVTLGEALASLLAFGLAVLAVPSLTFIVQVLLGAWTVSPTSSGERSKSRGRVTVLVPAHNEGAGITATVQSVLPQLKPGDRLLVVADNCSDDTAAVARQLGAEVTERFNKQLRGKGYALDHGINELRADAPDMVIMVDADCVLHPGALDTLAQRCHALQRPVQAQYLMMLPPMAPIKTKVAALAWLVKNKIRPLGASRLGWPCQLTGSGMAFPWAIISTAPLASGHLVEDMQLGVELACEGKPPAYCDEALVTSCFPSDDAALATQRTRWEHGHLGMIQHNGPRMLAQTFKRADWALLGMTLDLCVPPLTSLVMLLGLVTALCGVHAWVFDTRALIQPAALWMLAMIAAVLSAWWRHGRTLLSGKELLSIPAYALSKLSVYVGFVVRRQSGWVRTGRDDAPK